MELKIQSMKDLVENNEDAKRLVSLKGHPQALKEKIKKNIDRIIKIFEGYDNLQLLGGLSLHYKPNVVLGESEAPFRKMSDGRTIRIRKIKPPMAVTKKIISLV